MKSLPANITNLSLHGMNWIRQEKRLAIYLRDGLGCSYCGQGIEHGAELTLDHLRTRRNGGGHHHRNLVTACNGCNVERGEMPWRQFIRERVSLVNPWSDAAELIKGIVARLRLPLEIAYAKEIVSSRGSAAKALAAFNENTASMREAA